jgi:hypothetical protein
MTAKFKYNRDLLKQICERDACKVDFEKIEKYNRDIRIEFICCCGKSHSKTFRQLYEKSKGYCKECTINNTKKANVQKWGVENPAQSKEIKDKIKQVNLKMKDGVLIVL